METFLGFVGVILVVVIGFFGPLYIDFKLRNKEK